MYHVYVLKSLKNGKRYVGQTGKDPVLRLKEHNGGASKFTKSNRPFELLHTEDYESRTESIKRETFLKSGVGRKFLDGLFKGPLA